MITVVLGRSKSDTVVYAKSCYSVCFKIFLKRNINDMIACIEFLDCKYIIDNMTDRLGMNLRLS